MGCPIGKDHTRADHRKASEAAAGGAVSEYGEYGSVSLHHAYLL